MLSFPVSNVPNNYLAGDRKLSILHTRIRNNCSDLKFDLFSNGLSVHATCGCGYPIEDAEHYLFRCNYYSVRRLKVPIAPNLKGVCLQNRSNSHSYHLKLWQLL